MSGIDFVSTEVAALCSVLLGEFRQQISIKTHFMAILRFGYCRRGWRCKTWKIEISFVCRFFFFFFPKNLFGNVWLLERTFQNVQYVFSQNLRGVKKRRESQLRCLHVRFCFSPKKNFQLLWPLSTPYTRPGLYTRKFCDCSKWPIDVVSSTILQFSSLWWIHNPLPPIYKRFHSTNNRRRCSHLPKYTYFPSSSTK